MSEVISKPKIKLYCVFAMESVKKMGGIRGKLAAQSGHAFLHTFWDSEQRFPEMAKAYRQSGHAYKITLVVETVDELLALRDAYRDICGVSLVTDAGFTVFKNEDGSNLPTTTCLGIGPISEDDIGEDLRNIKTLS